MVINHLLNGMILQGGRSFTINLNQNLLTNTSPTNLWNVRIPCKKTCRTTSRLYIALYVHLENKSRIWWSHNLYDYSTKLKVWSGAVFENAAESVRVGHLSYWSLQPIAENPNPMREISRLLPSLKRSWGTHVNLIFKTCCFLYNRFLVPNAQKLVEVIWWINGSSWPRSQAWLLLL